MKNRLTIFKRIIAVILFVAIVAVMLTKYTNVIRERTDGSEHITGLTEVDNVDVVFIGSSVTHTAWLPYRAWEEYGITSFDFASSGHIMVGSEVGSIRYIKHRQPDTKLYVIDIRSYLKLDNEGEMPVTKTDNMSHFFDRAYTILDCYNLCGDKESMLSPINYIFDFVTYQTNNEALGDSAKWEYINNDMPAKFQGCSIMEGHREMPTPPAWSDERLPLNSYAERCLRHLLSYAEKNDINILFTLIPYEVSEEEMAYANTVEDIINEYDGDFVNLCSDKAPYEIDYDVDFLNKRHVNAIGAKKYTDYIGQYIADKYNLTDHRGDEKYSVWNEYAERGLKEEKKAEEHILSEVERKNKATEDMAQLKGIDDFAEWYNKSLLLEDLSVFMVTRGNIPEVTDDTKWVFDKLGFGDNEKLRCHWINSCGSIQNTEAETVNGSIRAQFSSWTITHVNDAGSIVIDGEERSLQKEGINVVAWDDNKARVVDCFVLEADGNGGVQIKRGMPEQK